MATLLCWRAGWLTVLLFVPSNLSCYQNHLCFEIGCKNVILLYYHRMSSLLEKSGKFEIFEKKSEKFEASEKISKNVFRPWSWGFEIAIPKRLTLLFMCTFSNSYAISSAYPLSLLSWQLLSFFVCKIIKSQHLENSFYWYVKRGKSGNFVSDLD